MAETTDKDSKRSSGDPAPKSMDPQGSRLPRDVVEDMPVKATCHQHTSAGSGVIPPSKIPQSEARIFMFIHSHKSPRNGSVHLKKNNFVSQFLGC